MREALSAEGAAAWRTHLAALAPPIAAAASERYYKVGSEALRACSAVCRVIRPDAPAPVPSDLQVRPGARADSEHVKLKLLLQCCLAWIILIKRSLGDIPSTVSWLLQKRFIWYFSTLARISPWPLAVFMTELTQTQIWIQPMPCPKPETCHKMEPRVHDKPILARDELQPGAHLPRVNYTITQNSNVSALPGALAAQPFASSLVQPALCQMQARLCLTG